MIINNLHKLRHLDLGLNAKFDGELMHNLSETIETLKLCFSSINNAHALVSGNGKHL